MLSLMSYQVLFQLFCSMLGLGDIVIPGIFVALLLRYDVHHGGATAYFYRCCL